MTWNGIIHPNVNEPHYVDYEELEAAVNKKQQTTTFHTNDVFGFDGDDQMTFVFVNKLNPICHQLLVPVAEFRKEFFA